MASTDAMYNAPSRSVQCKIEIHFGYDRLEPLKHPEEVRILTVYPNDYLMDMQVLEELCSAEAEPFGRCTANELTFTLYSPDGMFDPANATGEYSSRIVSGMMCKVFVKPDEDDASWDPLGVFYVTEWRTNVVEHTVFVTAHDKLYFALLEKGDGVLYGGLIVDETLGAYLRTTLDYYGVAVTVEDSAYTQQRLPFAVVYDDYANNLSSALLAALSSCWCDHNGSCIARSWRIPRAVRTTLADYNQIISMSGLSSSLAAYRNVTVPMYTFTEGAPQELCTAADVPVIAGSSNMTSVPLFKARPVVRLSNIGVVSTTPISITAVEMVLKTCFINFDASASGTATFTLYGTTAEKQTYDAADASSNAFIVDSSFVQTNDTRQQVTAAASQYTECSTQTYTLHTRGNPLLNLGDVVAVSSQAYNVDFTGIIARQRFVYNGALSCDMLVINSAAAIAATS